MADYSLKNNGMVEQGSLAWQRQRIGKFTGSRISDLLSSPRSKKDSDSIFGKTAMDYIYEVAAQRMLLPKYLDDDYYFEMYLDQVTATNKYIQFGHDNEEFAAEEYSMLVGCDLLEVDCIDHESIPFFAASPDRLVELDDGSIRVIEIKCPSPKTYMKYMTEIHDNASLLSVNPDYYYQMQSEMMVVGAKDAHFVCFCPFLRRPLHYCTILPDEEAVKIITYRVNEANKVVDSIINKKK